MTWEPLRISTLVSCIGTGIELRKSGVGSGNLNRLLGRLLSWIALRDGGGYDGCWSVTGNGRRRADWAARERELARASQTRLELIKTGIGLSTHLIWDYG